MNAVVMGAAVAAGKLGWEVVGIRDGFDGLLHPERYPDGGLVALDPAADREPGSGRRGHPRPVAPRWIRSTSARSTPTRWSRKWTCPMSCWRG
ncbi:MAG: hypothetical protein MZV64_04865 [Ignavibacteriales bacterium]|nr:hypothetical protein [Ignavibacteriales bacterium]